MSRRNSLWAQIVQALAWRDEVLSPEASGAAKYSYRNYRCEEGGSAPPRSENYLKTEEPSFTDSRSSTPRVEYCRA